MRRICILSALIAQTISGQFSELAVTDDGRLYFSSRLARGGENLRSKVYQVSSEGLKLIHAGEGAGATGAGAVLPLTNGDGSITGYAVETTCPNGFCGSMGSPKSVEFKFQGVSLGDINTTTTGRFAISRNGRYLVDASWNGRIIEIETTQIWKLPTLAGVAGYIANTGAVVFREAGTTAGPLQYVRPGAEPRPISGTESAGWVALSPNGDLIAYVRPAGNSSELVLTDPEGRSHRVVSTALSTISPFAFRASFANDGALLYLAPATDGSVQPMLVPFGGEPRPLVWTEPGVQTAILSGNGQIAWLVTNAGQLLRIRTADGGIDEFIPETPYLLLTSYFALPGSVLRTAGIGLSARTRFQWGDTSFPVTEASVEAATVQVPWELSSAASDDRLVLQGPASPFRQEVLFNVLTTPGIAFERAPLSFQAQIAHQDFRGIVTSQDPARPGETIHVFARNMGPVDQPIRTGERSPTSPAARVTTPFACYLFESGLANPRGLDVPFAGLSGGSIGVYQIDVTIPADWVPGKSRLLCTMDKRTPFDRDEAEIEIR